MGIQLAFFILISTGGVFCSAFFAKRYEETLPISCSAIVLTIFGFGLLNILKVGVYAVCAVCLVLYAAAIVRLVRKRQLKEFLNNLFTPAFFAFAVLFCAVTFLNIGRLATRWDEFSHWADSVKAMTMLDDFVSNPASHSTFTTYPPGMAIFQYFLQELCLLFEPEAQFCEWRLYFAHQIFLISFFFPFFKKLSVKRPIPAIAVIVAALACPLPFFPSLYTSIYIDPFIGVLSGAGFAMAFLCTEKDIFYYLYMCAVMAMLVLAKDAGMFLAVFVLIAVVLVEFYDRKNVEKHSSGIFARPWGVAAVSVASLLLPKLLWKLDCSINHATAAFSQKIDIAELFKIITLRDTSYRGQVWKDFFYGMLDFKTPLGETGVQISYILTVFIVISILCLLRIAYSKKDASRDALRRGLVGLAAIQFAVYLVGLAIVYVFKFTEFEAKILASAERYVGIIFLAEWTMAVILAIELVWRSKFNYNAMAVILLTATVAATPLSNVRTYVNRYSIEDAIIGRRQYDELGSKFRTLNGDESYRVYLISQGTKGYEYNVLRFILRPCTLQNGFWSIGQGPLYEEDAWTQTVSAEDWQTQLVQNFDYVVLERLDDTFFENYSELFENADDIHENSVYRVNTNTGMLELCK